MGEGDSRLWKKVCLTEGQGAQYGFERNFIAALIFEGGPG